MSIASSLLAWSRQPTTVAGLSTLAGVGIGVVSGATSWQTAIPLAVAGIVAVVLPDNAGAKTTAQTLAADLVTAEQVLTKS
jgi:hypothetical protein